MGKIIGIDLGTTNSVVAVMEGGERSSLPTARQSPDAVRSSIYQRRERLSGQIARRRAVTNPEKTVYSIKRFMGRRFAGSKKLVWCLIK
jgi:molecular chaperone DnaK